MGTRSAIAMKTEDGIRSIYCHWDGYVDHNGRILKEFYSTDEKVKAEAARQNRIKNGDLKNADTMDLLKDMYANADEEGKKSLAQAWETGEKKRNAHRMGW